MLIIREMQAVAAWKKRQPVGSRRKSNRGDDVDRVPSRRRREAVGFGQLGPRPAARAGGVIDAETQISGGGNHVKGKALEGRGA